MYDLHEANRLHPLFAKAGAQRPLPSMVVAIALFVAPACGGEPAAGPQASAASANGCADSAELVGALYGSIEADIDWRGSSLACEGMPRPEGAGARLRFAGTLSREDAGQTLAFIIALPDLERGSTATETPAKVTLIQEDSGRFFSNGEIDVCWSDVSRQERIEDERYAVQGIVYCVSPLAELNGSGGVSFTELRYAGAVDWSVN